VRQWELVGEAMPDASVTFSGEAIPLLILFVAHQKPSRGGLWHPILMQFYSGPLMHLLSGVDSCRSRRDKKASAGISDQTLPVASFPLRHEGLRSPIPTQPEVKGLTLMGNSIFNSWRMGDVWPDK